MSELPARRICGAKCKRTGTPCQRAPVLGGKRCRQHGGNGGRPPTTGLRSQALKKLQLVDKYAKALGDEELRSHRKNIALFEVAIAQKLEGLQPAAEIWKEAAKCLAKDDLPGLSKAIQNGLLQARQFEDALSLADRQRAHIESEHKREMELETVITTRQMAALQAALIHAITTTIKNPEERLALSRALSQILTSGA